MWSHWRWIQECEQSCWLCCRTPFCVKSYTKDQDGCVRSCWWVEGASFIVIQLFRKTDVTFTTWMVVWRWEAEEGGQVCTSQVDIILCTSVFCAPGLSVSPAFINHCIVRPIFQNVILGFIIFLLYYSPPPPVDFLALDFLTVSCKRSDDYFLFAAMFLLLFKKAFIRALITRALLSFSPRVIHSFAVSWLLKHFLRGGLLGFVFPPF